MPALTRRRSPDHRDERWEIYYGDIHAGTISVRTGKPQPGGDPVSALANSVGRHLWIQLIKRAWREIPSQWLMITRPLRQ
jgi:hypothetical protein